MYGLQPQLDQVALCERDPGCPHALLYLKGFSLKLHQYTLPARARVRSQKLN